MGPQGVYSGSEGNAMNPDHGCNLKAKWTPQRGTGTETSAPQSLRFGLRSQSPFDRPRLILLAIRHLSSVISPLKSSIFFLSAIPVLLIERSVASTEVRALCSLTARPVTESVSSFGRVLRISRGNRDESQKGSGSRPSYVPSGMP